MQYVQLHDLPAMWDETDFDLHVTALERNHQIDIDVIIFADSDIFLDRKTVRLT